VQNKWKKATDEQQYKKKNSLNTIYTMNWNSIKWSKAERIFIKLQLRILEAYKKKEMIKVEKLQIILIRSFAARALAIRKVTTNLGARTPGMDNVLFQSDSDKINAVYSLLNATPGKYLALPVKRVWIPKPNNPEEFRPLGIPTMYDRAVQALYNFALEPIATYSSDPNSFGFKEGVGTWDAITRLEKCIHSGPYPKALFEGDIKGYFNNISHQWILEHIPLPRPILQQFIKAGFILKGTYSGTTSGVPQGGIISPTIGNLVLDGLENHIKEAVVRSKSRIPLGIHIIRYADDFVITGPSSEKMSWVWTNVILKALNPFLTQRGLELNKTKSVLTYLEKSSATFLGVDVLMKVSKKGKKYLLITPSPKKVISFMARINTILKRMKTASAGQVILKLNPMIRGWAEYYKYANSTRIFRKMDSKMWSLYFGWLTHKYPRASRIYLYKTHFMHIGRSHVPKGHVKEEGRSTVVKLISFQDTKVSKYTVIRSSPSLKSKRTMSINKSKSSNL
jgi:RNA-directed DNA polymerase